MVGRTSVQLRLAGVTFGLLLLMPFVACEPKRGQGRMPMVERWDFSVTNALSKIEWGGTGWQVANSGDHQFVVSGPLHLRIDLPGERSLSGEFSMAFLDRAGEFVAMVSLDTALMSRTEVYEVTLRQAETLGLDIDIGQALIAWRDYRGHDDELRFLYVSGKEEGVQISFEIPAAPEDVMSELWMLTTVITWDHR